MRRHGAPAAVLAGAILSAAACRSDAGPTTLGEGDVLRETSAQCLTPFPGEADAGSAVISSRVASVFLHRSATKVVCLSEEEGRWRLRPSPGTEIRAE